MKSFQLFCEQLHSLYQHASPIQWERPRLRAAIFGCLVTPEAAGPANALLLYPRFNAFNNLMAAHIPFDFSITLVASRNDFEAMGIAKRFEFVLVGDFYCFSCLKLCGALQSWYMTTIVE